MPDLGLLYIMFVFLGFSLALVQFLLVVFLFLAFGVGRFTLVHCTLEVGRSYKTFQMEVGM